MRRASEMRGGRHHGLAARGQLRVYLGIAPGAGTTCALLREGQRRAERGADVIVATVQTHGWAGTAGLLDGLEIIPPVTPASHDAVSGEMDLGAVLARQPQIALVDELAHSNARGADHATRWQDAEELLAAGIDVISTASLGQLDSLSGVVEKITGVAPQQTVPDPVVRAAGEIELVDPTPEMLRDRMASRQIYPPGQAEEALAGWFRIGLLSALRELALLWLAVTRAQDSHQHYPGGHGHDGWRAALLNMEVPALRGVGR